MSYSAHQYVHIVLLLLLPHGDVHAHVTPLVAKTKSHRLGAEAPLQNEVVSAGLAGRSQDEIVASETVTEKPEYSRLVQVSDGKTLVGVSFNRGDEVTSCERSDSPATVKIFLSSTADHQMSNVRGLDVSAFAKLLAMCTEVNQAHGAEPASSSGGRQETGDGAWHSRSKRSMIPLIYPGTKWCGRGNVAANVSDLGTSFRTDMCCRTHDHCSKVIPPMTRLYNYFNMGWLSICHCDCDKRLRKCLRRTAKRETNSIAETIGSFFFDSLEMECFTFEYADVCTERSYLYQCLEHKRALSAVVALPRMHFSSRLFEARLKKRKEMETSTSTAKPTTTVPVVTTTSSRASELAAATKEEAGYFEWFKSYFEF